MARNSHLSIEERNTINNMLIQNSSLSAIAKALDRDISTIRHEIIKHRQSSKWVSPGRVFNNCELRIHCQYRGFCQKCHKVSTDKPCGKCSSCNSMCDHYVASTCTRRDKKPYCCNGCPSLHKCTLLKYLYKPDVAQSEYKYTLSDSRQGFNISMDEVRQMEPVIENLIRKKKQSVHAAVINNPDVFNVCERTLYNYIDAGIFETRNIDLPKKVRFMPRKSKVHHKIDKKCTVGRKYEDFEKYLSDYPGIDVVEFDSVEGPKGTPVLLTIFFRSCGLQLAFIRNSNNSASVIEIVNNLYQLLGHDDFTTLFPVILADNGTEFSNPSSIENFYQFNPDSGEIISTTERTKVFYCNPSSPFQKGACERNHEFIRYFVPKGNSFSDLSQSDINLMMNHINSYTRVNEKKNLKSPSSRFIFNYGESIASKLGITVIDPNDVTLSRSVFKK